VLFATVLGLQAPRLSHAAAGIDTGLLPSEAMPVDARQAGVELRRLAATASRRKDPWYRRALAAGIAHLDLQDPDQLDLLRRYGPFSTDVRIWVEGDPLPIVQAAEALDGRPRVTYRLDSEELDLLDTRLHEAGLVNVGLAPRRSLAEAWT
jgi:hypothetical protein